MFLLVFWAQTGGLPKKGGACQGLAGGLPRFWGGGLPPERGRFRGPGEALAGPGKGQAKARRGLHSRRGLPAEAEESIPNVRKHSHLSVPDWWEFLPHICYAWEGSNSHCGPGMLPWGLCCPGASYARRLGDGARQPRWSCALTAPQRVQAQGACPRIRARRPPACARGRAGSPLEPGRAAGP